MRPYFLTCLIIIFVGTIIGIVNGNAVVEFERWIFASLYGSGNTHYYPFYIPQIGAIWFLPACFIGTSIVRCSLDYKYDKRIIIIGLSFIIGYTTSKLLFWFPMSIQAGACCTLYVYLGWLFKSFEHLKFSDEIKTVVLTVSAFAWIQFVYNFVEFFIVRNDFGRGITDIIGSISASIVIFYISYIIDKSDNIIKKFLCFSGRYSLLILCVHIIELNFIPWHQLIVRSFNVSDRICDILLVFIKPIVICLIAFMLLKIRLIKRMFNYSEFI